MTINSIKTNLGASYIILLLCLIAGSGWNSVIAQTPVPKSKSDTTDMGSNIKIIHADRVGMVQLSDTSQYKFASGHVSIKQNNTYFYCDSVSMNPYNRIMEAYGNVHINDNDSINIYADFMRYRGIERTAFLQNRVKLTDGKGVLTTSQLDYDLNTKVAVYSRNGKFVNGKTVLTSTSGTYFADTKDTKFTQNVVLVDPDYTIKTDTLLYNTVTKLATFIVPTVITSGKYRRIETSDGYYDLLNKKSYLSKRPIIVDSSMTLIADEVAGDEIAGFGEARGNVVYKDTAQGVMVLCNDLKTNRVQSAFLATIHPVMVLKQDKDSIFIAADSLYSARFSDSALNPIKNESTDNVEADSTNKLSFSEDTSKVAALVSNLKIDSLRTGADTLNAAKNKAIPFQKVGKVFIWPKSATDANSPSINKDQDIDSQRVKENILSLDSSGKLQSNNGVESKGILSKLFQNKSSERQKLGNLQDTVPKSPKKGLFGIFKKKEKEPEVRKENNLKSVKAIPSAIDSVKNSMNKLSASDSSVQNGQKPGLDFNVKDRPISSKDSVKGEDNKSRFIEAYYNVRIYSDSLQGIGDSLYYSSKDSLFQLFKKPTVWTTSNHQISQLSGDTINMHLTNNKPAYLKVFNNAIMISPADTLHNERTKDYYNEIAGNKIEGWFTDGQLDSLSAQGNAQSVYYLLDAQSKYIGVNTQDSRKINFYFHQKQLQRIVYMYDVNGKTYPMRQVDHKSIRLKNFNWLEDKRPKSKFELLAR